MEEVDRLQEAEREARGGHEESPEEDEEQQFEDQDSDSDSDSDSDPDKADLDGVQSDSRPVGEQLSEEEEIRRCVYAHMYVYMYDI